MKMKGVSPCLYFIVLLGFLFPALPVSSQVHDLNYFLQQGLNNSPLLKDLSNQRRINGIDSMIARAGNLPQVNVDGLISYAPVINGFGYSEAITNGGNLISVVSVSQPLFNNKTLEARYARIDIQNKSVSNTASITRKELKKVITSSYLDAYGIYNELTFGNALLKSMNQEEVLLKTMMEHGIYKQTEYLSFLVELQSLEFHQNDLQTQYQKEISDLNLICGIPDTATYTLVLPDLEQAFSGEGQMSPFFLRFSLDSLKILNDKLLIDRDYRPKIGWIADAGLVNNDPAVIYKNFGLSLGLTFSLPVFDGNQRKLNYEKLRTTEHIRQDYRDFFRNQYNQQVWQLSETLRRTRTLQPKVGVQLKLAEAIIFQDKQLLESGGISITDYVIALKNYVTIQSNQNQYQIKILQLINEINYWKE